MADTGTLRRAFADFLGDEQFRKFVRQYQQNGRLRFWQEHEWERFVSARPEFVDNKDDLSFVLRVCWHHGTELRPDVVEVIDGNVDYADSYRRTRKEEFPCAALNPIFTEGGVPSASKAVWFCPACRIAEEEWPAAIDTSYPRAP